MAQPAVGSLEEAGFWCDVREGVGTTGDSLLARLAVPDASGVTLDGDLAAEGAGVTGVLRDFDLLHLLAEGGTIAGDSMLVANFHPSVFHPGVCRPFEDVRGVCSYRVPYLPVIPTSVKYC